MVTANASQECSGKWTNYFGKISRFCDTIGVENFQASHGWLFKWKNRFDIKFKDVVGEGNQVTPKYDLRDIYNLDEFGLFYQSLPKKTMHMRGKKCLWGKHSSWPHRRQRFGGEVAFVHYWQIAKTWML